MGWDGTPYPPDFNLIFEFTETVPFIFSVLKKIYSSKSVYSEFVACSTNRMADICGEDAAEFVARYTRRVAGTLIHVIISIIKRVSNFDNQLFCDSIR